MKKDEVIEHEIFGKFQRVKCIGDGAHVFDFLGSATNCTYKKGWEKWTLPKSKEITLNYPPKNEHYLDWIALLGSVYRAKDKFRMAELGAGWAPWLVRAVLACKQKNIEGENIELVGVEADSVHFEWMVKHFIRNGLDASRYNLINAAVGPERGVLKFPILEDPSADYGASVTSISNSNKYASVDAITLPDVLENFSGVVDFVHMDIQGEEYDVLQSSISEVNCRVKAIMVGTHTSEEKHNELIDIFTAQQCWEPDMIYPRNTRISTEFGSMELDDGFQSWINKSFR